MPWAKVAEMAVRHRYFCVRTTNGNAKSLISLRQNVSPSGHRLGGSAIGIEPHSGQPDRALPVHEHNPQCAEVLNMALAPLAGNRKSTLTRKKKKP
jgi:hypothetical protein